MSRKQILLGFLNSENVSLETINTNDSDSEETSSWFERSHPEHELGLPLTDNMSESPNFVRTRLGPPVRVSPKETAIKENEIFSINNNDRDILLSPNFSSFSSKPKRSRTSSSSFVLNSVNGQPLFFSPRNITFSSDNSTSTTASFISDSFFSSLSSPSKHHISPLSSKKDNYFDDEYEIETAPVSKLLQAFLDKKHRQSNTPSSPVEKQDENHGKHDLTKKQIPNAIEHDAPQKFSFKEHNLIEKDSDGCRPFEKHDVSNVDLKTSFNALHVKRFDIKREEFNYPAKSSSSKKNIIQAPQKDGQVEASFHVLKDISCITGSKHKLTAEKTVSEKFVSEPEPFKEACNFRPPWNPVGTASLHKTIKSGTAKDEVNELFELLAEHNARIRKHKSTINVRR